MRRLKVYRKVVQPSGNMIYSSVSVPEIVLSGKWLESLGFKPGDFIKVQSKRESIQIYKESKENSNERK